MIRTVVIPFGRGGIIGGSMLGLGRALGETIAVYLIISPILDYTTHPLQSGSNTIAAFIASRSTESSTIGLDGLLGAGLVLFLLTLLVNSIAAVIVAPVALRRGDRGMTTRRRATGQRRATPGPYQLGHPGQLGALAGSALGALALVWLLFERLLPLSGLLGFWFCWYAAFLVLLGGRRRGDAGPARCERPDRLAGRCSRTAGLVLFSVLALVVGFVVQQGLVGGAPLPTSSPRRRH